MIVLNIYFPYYAHDIVNEYCEYAGKFEGLIEEYSNSEVLFIGDFNANIDCPFYTIWKNFALEQSLLIVDTFKLPAHSLTHVNNASLSRS